jgi:hypothetical protein
LRCTTDAVLLFDATSAACATGARAVRSALVASFSMAGSYFPTGDAWVFGSRDMYRT